MIHMTSLTCTINATTTGCDLELSMSQLGHDPQPIYQNKERLLSRCNQVGGSILTKVYFFSLD